MMIRAFFMWLIAGLFGAFLALLLGLLWYLLLPPLLVPVSYRFNPDTGIETLTREVLGAHGVSAIWHHAVTLPSGQECHDTAIRFYARDRNIVTRQAPPDLMECLRKPGSISRIEWRPLYREVLPMAPVRLIVTYDQAIGVRLPPNHPPITQE